MPKASNADRIVELESQNAQLLNRLAELEGRVKDQLQSRKLARWIIFTLDEQLSKADEFKPATVTQNIDGIHPDPEGNGINVYNLRTQGSTYVWKGKSGDYGQAFYAPEEGRYYIANLPCSCGGASGAPCTDACDEGDAPAEFTVVISGITDDTCTECAANYNGTFVLQQQAPLNPCKWKYEYDTPVCDHGGPFDVGEVLELELTESGGTVTIEVAWKTGDGIPANIISWQATEPATIDCLFSGRVIPFATEALGCLGASSTCTVTAVE